MIVTDKDPMKNKKNLFISLLMSMVVMISVSARTQTEKNIESMKEKILGLRTCAYMVGNLEEAKKWYAGAFGVKPYFDEPYYVGFNIGGYELGLMPADTSVVSTADNVVTYWGVEDVAEMYDKFIALGAKSHEEPHSVGEPLVVASVRDPWGNVIGFIYNPVFKAE